MTPTPEEILKKHLLPLFGSVNIKKEEK